MSLDKVLSVFRICFRHFNDCSISQSNKYLSIEIINSFGVRLTSNLNGIFLSQLSGLIRGVDNQFSIAAARYQLAILMCESSDLTSVHAFVLALKLICGVPYVNGPIGTSCVAVPFGVKNSTIEICNAALVPEDTFLE